MPRSTKSTPLAASVEVQSDAKGQTHFIIRPQASAGIGTDPLKLTPRQGSTTDRRAQKALTNARLATLPSGVHLPDGTFATITTVNTKKISFVIEPDLLRPEQSPVRLTFAINRHNRLEGYLTDDVHSYGTEEEKDLISQVGTAIGTQCAAWVSLAQDAIKEATDELIRLFGPPAEDVPVTTLQIPARKIDIEHVLVLDDGRHAVVRAISYANAEDDSEPLVVLNLTSHGQDISLALALSEEVTVLTGDWGRYERRAQFEDSPLQQRIDAQIERDRPAIEDMKAMLTRRFGAGTQDSGKTVLEETLEINARHYSKDA